MRIFSSLSLICLVAGAAPSVAAAADQAKPADAAKQRTVCVQETVVGSRLGAKKTCHTVEEWDQIKHDNRDDVEKAQRLAKMPGQQ